MLRIWPRRTTTCSLDWKNNWKVAIFGPTLKSLLPRRPGWTDKLLNFFLSSLQKLEQRDKKCIELRGEYVEKIPSLVAVACFLPGRAKDLQAPPRIYLPCARCLTNAGGHDIYKSLLQCSHVNRYECHVRLTNWDWSHSQYASLARPWPQPCHVLSTGVHNTLFSHIYLGGWGGLKSFLIAKDLHFSKVKDTLYALFFCL